MIDARELVSRKYRQPGALKTSQPQIARMESGATDVSLDQMFHGLFALGGTIRDVLKAKST